MTPSAAIRPMSLGAAALWAFLAFTGSRLLAGLAVALREGSERDLVTIFASVAIAFLLALVAILRLHAPEAPLRDVLGLRRTHPGLHALALVLALPGWAVAEEVGAMILRRFPEPATEAQARLDVLLDPSPVRQALHGVIIVALGPLLEEVFFRGALYRGLRLAHSRATAVVASAALFAVVHVDPRRMFPILLVGLALGYLRSASGSLLPALLLHGGFNGVSYALLLADPSAALSAEIPPFSATRFAPALVATAAVLGGIEWLARRSEAADAARREDRT